MYSSTCRCNSASRLRRLCASSGCASSSSPSRSGSAFSTRRFLPITSSARRCCLSAGVSVQSVLSTTFGVAVERENWRGLFSFVGSSAVQREGRNERMVESPLHGREEVKEWRFGIYACAEDNWVEGEGERVAHCSTNLKMWAGRASTRRAEASWGAPPPVEERRR